MSTFTDIRNYYFKHFRHKPVYVKAPGRINLAGEHLDYNLGFALPSAIDRYVYFAASKNGEQSLVRIYSVDYNEYFEANTLQLAPIKYHWSNYITGVIQMLQMYSGRSISGFDVVFGGDLPRGAGLSSSAAVECGMAVTLCHLFGIEIDRMQLAKLCLQAEHEFAGVKCGLLDQFSSLFGKAGFVMSINFKTLNYRYIPLNMDGFSVLMFNTNKPHTLAEGNEFNKRVASCRQGVEALQQHIVNIDCLCDASPGQLNEVKANLDEVSFDRCTYIVEENIRYHQALKALEEIGRAHV